MYHSHQKRFRRVEIDVLQDPFFLSGPYQITPMEKERETKRRFFRRTGLSRAQRSLDSSSCSSPIPSHSPSLENNSVVSCGAMIPSSSSVVGISTPPRLPSAAGSLAKRTGASSSLDETVISNKIDRQNRRFMAAPRRARSAERFDGMRIAFNNSSGEDVPRNFHSPQLARLGNSVQDVGRPGSGGQTPTAAGTPGGVATMPSPPPPYTAVTDITGPPSYRQAVAAMTAQAVQQRSTGTKKAHPRYTMANRSTQSFDISGSISGGSLRSASSVPTFSDEVLCRCSKCQAFQRPNDMNNCGEYNDAVYMESQAFLMHEIMTDGMAFCSVM